MNLKVQSILSFSKHNLKPAIEIIDSSRIEEIFEKLSGKNDEVIRYVLDVQKSLK